MQAHVKTPHTDIILKGDIDPRVMEVLEEVYGKESFLENDPDDELVDIRTTEWYRKSSKRLTAGKTMKIYRENHGLTQAELGEKLGGISAQNISHMERDIRSISIKNAKKLAQLFQVSVEKFIT